MGLIETSRINTQRAVDKKEKEMQEMMKRMEVEMVKRFKEEKDELEKTMHRELEDNADKMRKKSKMELESLRSRFRMMQTTATLDKSPSVSESELSLEDLRHIVPSRVRCYSTGEFFVKSPRSEVPLLDGKFEERNCWELEREQLKRELETCRQEIFEREAAHKRERDEFEATVQDIRKSEKLRNSAEKQVIFNEAIKKAVQEKDKKIEELDLKLANQHNRGQHSDLESQLAEVSRKNAQLESELREANQKLTNSMQCSIVPQTEENLKQLQEENRQLKDQLSKSMTSLISTGKVSVMSADKGEIVLLIWSDVHNNYSVYHEGNIMHFLHTESIEEMGL